MAVELGREESRSRLQDFVGPTQLAILTLQFFEAFTFISRDAGSPALINLDALHPLPNRSLAHLRRIPARPSLLGHGSIRPRTRACALPGELQVRDANTS